MERLSNIDTIEYDRGVLNILTIAKLSKEKGHFRALEALYRLKEDGVKFCWHIVGDGKELPKLKEKISEYNLSRNVILYGEQNNPYKFYKNADVLLMPSYYEGSSIIFSECEFFNLPIVATRTTSTDELVTDKNLGIVCENSEAGIYKAFEYIFKNPNIIREIKNFEREAPNNIEALREFYEIIQGDNENE
jgi:glycosyltransferase involved in cell wall biosynthesis